MGWRIFSKYRYCSNETIIENKLSGVQLRSIARVKRVQLAININAFSGVWTFGRGSFVGSKVTSWDLRRANFDIILQSSNKFRRSKHPMTYVTEVLKFSVLIPSLVWFQLILVTGTPSSISDAYIKQRKILIELSSVTQVTRGCKEEISWWCILRKPGHRLSKPIFVNPTLIIKRKKKRMKKRLMLHESIFLFHPYMFQYHFRLQSSRMHLLCSYRYRESCQRMLREDNDVR